MREGLRVLLAGESWITYTLHIKGVDSFWQSGYGEGTRWLRRAVERSGGCLTHMPSHQAIAEFPATLNALRQHDVIVLSDIGSNTLLLHPDTTERSLVTPNRLEALRDFVWTGGAVIMIGGYMSFQGIHGMARYHETPVEALLPVEMLDGKDDRVEVPAGFQPTVVDSQHSVTMGLPNVFPTMLFYNKVVAKPGSDVLLGYNGDVILAVWDYGSGRAAAFTPDIAPHGATADFLDWEYFDRFWHQLLTWLARGH